MPDVIVMPTRPSAQVRPEPVRSLSASECAEVIARMLHKSAALRRINPDLKWEDDHPMERSRCRSSAEYLVAQEIAAVERTAEAETKLWVLERLRSEHGEDYPADRLGAFCDELIRDAVAMALDEHRHQVAKAYRLIGGAR